jgi:hypothetical protein
MTKELEEALSHTWTLRNTLKTVLVPEVVDYIMTLVAQDSAHRKFVALCEEFEKEQSEEK